MAHPFAVQAQKLREKLQSASDIAEPWDYFHESLVSSPRFLGMGVRKENPELWKVVAFAVSEALGKPQRIGGGGFLFHLPELHLWHGTTFVAGLPLVVFYFDDLDQGVAGLLRDLATMQSSLIRFSLVPVPEGATPVLEPGQA
jgi:hypothetical protein